MMDSTARLTGTEVCLQERFASLYGGALSVTTSGLASGTIPGEKFIHYRGVGCRGCWRLWSVGNDRVTDRR